MAQQTIMPEEVMSGNGNEYTTDPNKPVDIDHWQMSHFSEEYSVTTAQQSNVAYSTAMIDKWFDITEQPAREDAVAICGYGPSLPVYIQELKNFNTIVTASGAHKVVLDAGFVPTYHVEIDWKPHKSRFTETTHPDCTYIMSSLCNPATIDNVKDRKAELMFIDHGPRIEFPMGSQMIYHGYDVGQQAIECMRLKGFRKFMMFGFDYCFTKDLKRHAGEHGGIKHIPFYVRSQGQVFLTSKTMFTTLLVMDWYARQHPECEFGIYSDSLCASFMTRPRSN